MNTFFSPLYQNTVIPWNTHQVRHLCCPLISNAAKELHQNVKAPFGICLMTTISAVSLACQDHIDVFIPFGKGTRKPTSLYIMIVADSGERKSAIFEIVLEKIRAFDNAKQIEHEELVKAYQIELAVWEEKRSVLGKLLQKKIAREESTDEEEAALREHLANRPEKPIKPKLIFEDATNAAVFERLSKGSTSAGIISGEGGSVTDSPVFNDQPLLNALWSGEVCVHDTKTGGELKLDNVRLMMSAAIQSGTLRAYLDNKGASFRDTGFGSRFLFCDAGSAQGTRFIDNNPGSSEYIDKFNNRLQALLDLTKPKEVPDIERQLMVFSADAKWRFHDFYNWVEQALNPGGKYEHAKDHASKLPENVARVAALLQFFEHGVSEITMTALDDAIAICQEASNDFIKWFVSPPQDYVDACTLSDWFNYQRSLRLRYVSKNSVLQRGPSSLRNKSRYEPALAKLLDDRSVCLMRERKSKRLVLDLLPSFPSVDPELIYVNVR